MLEYRHDTDSGSGSSRAALCVIALSVLTLLSGLLFGFCAFNLEAWGPPSLLLGTGIGLLGVLVGGVMTLGLLLRLLAQVVDGNSFEDAPGQEDETDEPGVDLGQGLIPRLFGDRLGPAVPETLDRGG